MFVVMREGKWGLGLVGVGCRGVGGMVIVVVWKGWMRGGCGFWKGS